MSRQKCEKIAEEILAEMIPDDLTPKNGPKELPACLISEEGGRILQRRFGFFQPPTNQGSSVLYQLATMETMTAEQLAQIFAAIPSSVTLLDLGQASANLGHDNEDEDTESSSYEMLYR